jgi:CheY-like chemotaxis protein
MRQYLKCEAFLSKPFEEENLLELLQQYLHLKWIYAEEEPKILMN